MGQSADGYTPASPADRCQKPNCEAVRGHDYECSTMTEIVRLRRENRSLREALDRCEDVDVPWD
jgi:hypothetical protein